MNPAKSRAFLRCVESSCAETYPINEQLYACTHCAGLLDVRYDFKLPRNAEEMKTIFEDRRGTNDLLALSGVWRFHELLPFAGDLSRVVTLAEGNTPIYEAPRSAEYAGVDRLR